MADANWKDVPLYLYTSPDQEEFILPTDREFRLIEEQINQMEAGLQDLKDQHADKDRIKANESMLFTARANLQRLRDKCEELKPQSKQLAYAIKKPGYAEFLSAEEACKDWIVGEPRINESLLAIKAMANHVRKGETVLNETQVGEMPYPEARKIWEEFQFFMYPNHQRLPFLNSLSTTP